MLSRLSCLRFTIRGCPYLRFIVKSPTGQVNDESKWSNSIGFSGVVPNTGKSLRAANRRARGRSQLRFRRSVIQMPSFISLITCFARREIRNRVVLHLGFGFETFANLMGRLDLPTRVINSPLTSKELARFFFIAIAGELCSVCSNKEWLFLPRGKKKESWQKCSDSPATVSLNLESSLRLNKVRIFFYFFCCICAKVLNVCAINARYTVTFV